MAAETPNRHYPVPDENAVPPESGTEAFLKLKAAAGLIDKDIKDLLDGLNGKAAKIHTHGMGEVEGLSGALGEKMPASRTFKLDDLTDVDGADAADTGYVLVKTVGGLWVAQAALSALGDHKHTIPQVDGLTEALASKQGTSGRGTANGYAPLDADGKVPTANLPLLTTTATVGAAIAGANGKSLPADGDRFAGILAGASTVFHTTWGNIKAALSGLFVLKTGDVMSGSLQVNGGSMNIQANDPTGNAHTWYRHSDGAWRVVTYADKDNGFHISAGRGTANFDFSASGNFVAPGTVAAAGGAAFLNGDGNVYGTKWGTWGVTNWAFEAIDNRIEQRAQDWANAKVANRPTGDQVSSVGFWGGDGSQPYFNGAPGVTRLPCDKSTVDSIAVFALLQYTGSASSLGPNQLVNSSELCYANAASGDAAYRPQGTWMLFGRVNRAVASPQGLISVWQRKY